MTANNQEEIQKPSPQEVIQVQNRLIEGLRRSKQELEKRIESITIEHNQLKNILAADTSPTGSYFRYNQKIIEDNNRQAQEYRLREDERKAKLLEQQRAKVKADLEKRVNAKWPELQRDRDNRLNVLSEDKQDATQTINAFFDMSKEQLRDFVNTPHQILDSPARYRTTV